MQFKEKLVYIALGGVLVVVGQLLPNVLVPRVVAQSEATSVEYDTVTCRNLKIVDSLGNVWAQLKVIRKGTPVPAYEVIQVFNKYGTPVHSIGVSDNSGDIRIKKNDGSDRIWMQADYDGGTMAIMGENKFYILMSGDGMDGGAINLMNDKGSICASMKAEATGSDGGSINVLNGKGLSGITMDIWDGNGEMRVYGKDGKSRVKIGVNKDGQGVITTYDNHDYKTGGLP